MTSEHQNGLVQNEAKRLLRRDLHRGRSDGATNTYSANSGGWWARIERPWWGVLAATIAVFSAVPIANLMLGLPTKDYGLWYQVGLAVRQGLDIYPRPETGRLFPFMYPPSAAAMLAWLSLLGPYGSLLALVAVNSLSWIACIGLSAWLAAGPRVPKHPLILIVPTLATIVLIYNIYLLGQPNLLLLALMLLAFVCLRLKRDFVAGALIATAAAIKAFPILALAYLIYRRMWKASTATIAALAAWLLIAPLPFRTPAQAVDDVVVWSQGMLFTYNTHGIAQRPFRSYSYKNQSIMALFHRLLRDVPADGEAVLARKSRAIGESMKQTPSTQPTDPSTDLLSFLKPHATASQRSTSNLGQTHSIRESAIGVKAIASGERAPRWDDALQGAEPALRSAWRVNFLDLSFRNVTAVTGAAILILCLSAAAVLPRNDQRTPQTDAIEFALVVLLTVMFSPLSFNYAYVWLIYPTTLALHLVLSQPPNGRWHRLKVAWVSAVLLIPALAIPMPLLAQAYGNLFVPALLLVLGLGVILLSSRTGASRQTTPVWHCVFPGFGQQCPPSPSEESCATERGG
jgi:alpha-1,2-mannosyltransferase